MRSFFVTACSAIAIMAFANGASAYNGTLPSAPQGQVILAATTTVTPSRPSSPPPAAARPSPPSSLSPGSLGLPPKPSASAPPAPSTLGLPPKPSASAPAPSSTPAPSALGLPPKPGATAATAAPAPSTLGLPPKPDAVAGTGAAIAAAPKPTASDNAAGRVSSQAALDKYRAQTAAARPAPSLPAAAPVAPTVARTVPVYRSVASTYPTRTAYVTAYSNGWGGLPYRNTLVIVRPSYGIWDSGTFAVLLAASAISANNLSWAYAMQHSQDEANRQAYYAWHADMVSQAASNAEVRAKLADLDRQVSTMQPPAKAPDLPDGVTPAMAVTPDTVLADSSIPDDTSSGGGKGWIVILVVLGLAGAAGYYFVQRGRAYREGRL